MQTRGMCRKVIRQQWRKGIKKDRKPHHAVNIWCVLFKNKRNRYFYIPPPTIKLKGPKTFSVMFAPKYSNVSSISSLTYRNLATQELRSAARSAAPTVYKSHHDLATPHPTVCICVDSLSSFQKQKNIKLFSSADNKRKQI